MLALLLQMGKGKLVVPVLAVYALHHQVAVGAVKAEERILIGAELINRSAGEHIRKTVPS